MEEKRDKEEGGSAVSNDSKEIEKTAASNDSKETDDHRRDSNQSTTATVHQIQAKCAPTAAADPEENQPEEENEQDEDEQDEDEPEQEHDATVEPYQDDDQKNQQDDNESEQDEKDVGNISIPIPPDKQGDGAFFARLLMSIFTGARPPNPRSQMPRSSEAPERSSEIEEEKRPPPTTEYTPALHRDIFNLLYECVGKDRNPVILKAVCQKLDISYEPASRLQLQDFVNCAVGNTSALQFLIDKHPTMIHAIRFSACLYGLAAFLQDRCEATTNPGLNWSQAVTTVITKGKGLLSKLKEVVPSNCYKKWNSFFEHFLDEAHSIPPQEAVGMCHSLIESAGGDLFQGQWNASAKVQANSFSNDGRQGYWMLQSTVAELQGRIKELEATHRFNEMKEVDFVYTDKDLLGEGGGGRVFKVRYNGAYIAVKFINIHEPFDEKSGDKTDPRHEISVMQRIPPHPNVVGLLGFSVSQSRPLVGMTLTRDSLEKLLLVNKELPIDFIKAITDADTAKSSLKNYTDLIWYLVGASAGLIQLHAHNVVHGDVAARNFLVDFGGSCCVCDFGLSQILPTGETTVQSKPVPVPIAWMAPESLSKLEKSIEWSAKTDVYAFGVMIVEVMSRDAPYHGVFGNELLQLIPRITDPRHPYRPHIAGWWPADLASLAQECMSHRPADRPTMANVNSKLHEIHSGLLNAKGLSDVYRPFKPKEQLMSSNYRSQYTSMIPSQYCLKPPPTTPQN